MKILRSKKNYLNIAMKTIRKANSKTLCYKHSKATGLHKTKSAQNPQAKKTKSINLHRTKSSRDPQAGNISRSFFKRLVKSLTKEFNNNVRYDSNAIKTLQEVSESYLVRLFRDSKILTINANRRTVMPKDMQSAGQIHNYMYLDLMNSS